jgi:DNA-directed RNA polymerase specialized sigma24 family protein
MRKPEVSNGSQKDVARLIGPAELVRLYRLYPYLLNVLQSLFLDLERQAIGRLETDDEIIAALALAGRKLDDLPLLPEGHKSDRTAYVALVWERIKKYEKEDIAGWLSQDMVALSVVIDKIRIAINALTIQEQRMMELLYWEDNSWEEVAHKIGAARSTVQYARKKVLSRMIHAARIMMEDYRKVMALIGEVGEG